MPASPEETLVALETTGALLEEPLAALAAAGFEVARLNPLRTARFAGEDLQRTKTDAIDALSLEAHAEHRARQALLDELTRVGTAPTALTP